MYRVTCLNCGKKGHTNKTCRFPTNSYGCVLFKKSEDDKLRYLLIQKKYTPEYVDVIRGLYYNYKGELNYTYLCSLVAGISLIERYYILRYDFDYLWHHIWLWRGTDEQMEFIRHNYQVALIRFNLLKQGTIIEGMGPVSFQHLFDLCPTTVIEPPWEIPKGKRCEGENDQECAIRECCEETALDPNEFHLFLHVRPFQERFTGINGIKYCNNYYLGHILDHQRLMYYNPKHREQNKEIRKIGWFTEDEIPFLASQHCCQLIKDVSQLAPRLLGGAELSVTTS